MNLHEYQAKKLLIKFELPLLKGKSYIKTLDGIENDFNNLKGPPWVVKSQIHAGGRGAGYFKNPFNDKGGVQIVDKISDAISIASSMMGNILITKQTGIEGKRVNRIFIEEGCNIDKEYYLSILIDRNSSQLMMMISSSGGMDIEQVAENNPEKIHNVYFKDINNISLPDYLEKELNISAEQFIELNCISKKLVNVFKGLDATTIEINPLVLNKEGKFIILDAKISLDDNALFRHQELENLKDLSEEEPLELEAAQNDMNYVKLKVP